MDPIRPVPGPTPSEETLDPRSAAELLVRTRREARRRLDPTPPVLSAVSALAVPTIYGALWFSVRGQHPYRGPSLGVIGLAYLLVAVTAIVSAAVYERATAGISGRSRREQRLDGLTVGVAVVGFYTFLGALEYDGFSAGVVYGVVDAAGPWLVVGAVLAGLAAAREDWWRLAGGCALVVVGAGAAFAGPIDVWGVLAVASGVLLLAQTALRLVAARRP